jgi:peptidoglycan hydrolase-like protein with peptidoglycan-binding domain
MADTQWADISEFQKPVDNSYPYQVLCIRSNDGNYQDKNFNTNRAWCDSAVASGKLAFYIVYYFFRPSMTGFPTLKARVGTPNPKMAVMIDVESDGGKVSGNQSGNINSEFNQAASWLGSASRVIGYGNVGDLNNLWPQKPAGIRLVVANYSSNPSYAGKFAHQYTDKGPCAPFGTCDMNSADGMAISDLNAMFGFSGTPAPAPPPPPPAPTPTAPAFPYPSTDYLGTPSPDPHCHSGHYGPPDSNNVKTWQQQMVNRGWTSIGTVDGDYGPKSQNVCKQFQQEKGLKVDGLVGPQTWAASWTAPVT